MLNTVPYSYQLRGVRQLHKDKGRGLLAFEMGLGKTLTSLLYADRHPELRPIVVVCPPSVKWNWEREAKAHIGMRAQVLETTRPPKEKPMDKAPLYIVGDNLLAKRRGKGCGPGWLTYLKELEPKLIIVDEIHRESNRTSARSKAVKSLCTGVDSVIGLSGTPLTNRPSELWFPCSILWPHLFPNFFDFAQHFCAPKRMFYGWDFSGASNLDELHEILTKAGMQRLIKTDVLTNLPPKQRIVLPVDIENRKEYNKAVNDFINWLKEIDAKKAKKAARAEKLVKMGYLARLASQLKLSQVYDWLDNFLVESDGKIIVFGVHTNIVRGIYERYKKLAVVIDGSVTGKDRQVAVDIFQNKKSCRMCVGNIKAAGTGINLQAASTVAFAELPWSPGELVQAEDRAYRIGTINPVFVYYLIARNTIEEHLCDVLTTKQSVASQILDGKVKEEDLNLIDDLEMAIRNGFNLVS